MRAGLLVLVGVSGAIVGAALHYSLTRPESTHAVSPQVSDAPAGERGRAASPVPEERANLYRAAAAARRGELDAMIRETAAQPKGAERTFALHVLLLRYAELDPKAAVAAAAGLDAAEKAPLYAAWARTDPASALAALAAVKDRAAARVIAATLVPALGGDDRALREVAAAVPFGVESAVYADALTARAAEAPAGAFRQALDLTDLAARSQALEGVAAEWARLDAPAALAAIDEVYDPSQRQLFMTAFAKTWARLDPDASLEYLRTMDASGRQDVLAAVARQLADVRPKELLEIAGTGSPMAQNYRALAIRGLAVQDLALALREAEALPAGGQRENALGDIARSYGARDPDAALAWARASGDTSRVQGVLQGIAQRDTNRAFDLAVALESPQQRLQALQQVLMLAATPSGPSAAALAERALTLTDAEIRATVLQQVLGRWSSTAPEAALDWLLGHEASAAGSYLNIAQQLARSNPKRAAEYTARIPASSRAEWIQGTASGYAQNDPQGAAQWLAQYEGDPVYSSAGLAVAVGLARTDPATAARLLTNIKDGDAASRGVYPVAQQWARRDPTAAAAWAAEYDARTGTTGASQGVVVAWAQSDAPAARAWTLRMPAGQSRDAALSALLTARPAEPIDKGLLDAFSDAQFRNLAVVNAAMRLANTDRLAAARLLDAYVTDDALREQTKRNLERPPMSVMYDNNGVTGVYFAPR